MNWLKKGPELKLSELKVPDFVYDLFYDLKERHLLPLVALLLVAMVAAPIYFKNSTGSDPGPATTLGPTATASSVDGRGETIVVARSEPGLRDYRRRLKDYRALDPFAGGGEGATTSPEVTNSAPSVSPPVASTPEATVTGGESGSSVEVPAEVTISPESAGVPAEPSTGSTTVTKTRYASDTIDVRIVTVPHGSSEEKQADRAKPQAQVRRNLPELTMLPARATPAATYIGLTNDGTKALFVVSSDVVSLFGEANCVIGSQSCQLLALEPGLPETFVYGAQERTYRIELLKIDQTYASKPRRANLGAGKGKGDAKNGGGEGSGSGPAERG
ncbi:MAG TPA: hypothetical protein VN522_04210 [Solirubrobacterales bacterium]|nr:hypothetical protein [Solirubrobacterales bacterium]